MNEIELNGTIFYEPTTNQWTSSGTGWWIEKTDNHMAKITFEEPITFDSRKISKTKSYSLFISNINQNGDVDTYHVDENGFIVTWKNYSNETCIASFQVVGSKACFVPNDRNLGTQESVADIYAAELLFSYEAKYGVITLMGSGTISCKEIAKEKLDILGCHADEVKIALEKENHPLTRKLLQDRLNKTNMRMERHKKMIEKSAKYWDSALQFGELWGHYSANEQEDVLGGCYVPLCTGGGPGIMQAAAQGARNKDAHIIGIDCQFGVDNFFNLKDTYSIQTNQRLRLNNFSIREGVLINYSHVILFWPGGFGTAWEVFETLSKIQTNHLRKHRTKAIFVHPEYWEPIFKCIDSMREHGAINSYGDRIKIPGIDDQLPEEAYIAEVANGPVEAFEKTKSFVEELYQKNQLTLKE
ncbi:LOG family protein [Shimazuella sp. AN120528]|uniref:LOG family protein n=1 Tax=Shimazuella soli TaxID=1892854 RepID=UPI001F0E62B1|nr:LOG family protein [Shimazuella soli]MCH5585583.1 LOG family protein [Shimazuella soli]